MSVMQYFNLASAPLPLAWNPSWAFPDAWFDPSDASTVFVGRTGTVPATAGSPVGQIKDKSGKGNHAVAPTDAARPTLARMPKTGRRNLLTYTEDLTGAPWQSVSVIKTSNKLVATTLNAQHRIDRNIVVPVGAVYSAIVKPAGLNYFGVRFDFSLTSFNLVAGTILLNENGASGIEALGDGSFKIRVTNINTEKPILRLNISDTPNATATFIGDGISGVELNSQQLEVGPTVTSYQKVTNDFDVTEVGVSEVWSLEFDGADDYLTIPSPITLPSDYTLFAAHDLSLKQSGLITSALTSCGWWMQSVAIGRNAMRSRASDDWVFGPTIPLNKSRAVSMVSSKGTARWNGVMQSLLSSVGTIKPLAEPLSQIGKRGNASDFIKGSLMGIMIFGREMPDIEAALIENFLAKKAGTSS